MNEVRFCFAALFSLGHSVFIYNVSLTMVERVLRMILSSDFKVLGQGRTRQNCRQKKNRRLCLRMCKNPERMMLGLGCSSDACDLNFQEGKI